MSEKEISSLSSTLIIGFNPFAHKISRSSFNAKLPLHSHHYAELSLFRQYIEQQKTSSYQLHYTISKKQVFFYRSIFLFFGFLFAVLGALVFFKTSSWSSLHLSSHLIKPLVTFFCGTLAALAFMTSFFMRADKESVYSVVRKAKLVLSRIYGRRRVDLGLQRLLYFGRRYRQLMAYRHFYHETKDKIHDLKEDAIHLISKIAYSPFEKKQKEILYNQAISELNDKLTQLVLSFKHAPIHIYNLENF